MERWVKLYEKITEWEWHDCPEMVSLFIHLLLYAKPTTQTWHGIEVKRGSFITTYRKLSTLTGIAQTTLVRCIDRLKKTKEIDVTAVKAERSCTLISVCKYDTYQAKKESSGTNSEQTRNGNGTNSEQTRNGNGTNSEQVLDNKNNRKQNFKDKENKETFLKNGGTAEKKVFQISELEKILSAENIYMTAQGYQEFKNLNESDDRYGYKGGVIRSAKIFLKNPKNAIYRKNAPPAPRPQQKPPDQAALKAASEIWEKVKKILAEEIMPQSFKTWILPIVPLKLESGALKIQVPSQYFQEYLEGNYIQLLSKALNDNGIKQLIYSIKIKN